MGTTSPPRTDPIPRLAWEAAENPLAEGLEQQPVDPTTLVVFGATGDLARRKLLPAVYNLAHDGSLPGHFDLLGVARADMTDEAFREMAALSIRRHSRRAPDEAVLRRLLERLHFLPGDFDDDDAYEGLGDRLATFERAAGLPLNRSFYLATAPKFFASIVRRLGDHGLHRHANAAVRVVIEKPFGRDLEDAQQLNRAVLSVFSESQVYRIDHYLGKETVQNLLALRFANELFEPIWNRNHISHVQITAAEDLGIEGRAGYYDATGALRDLVQNHLLQLLCHIAMEPPIEFTADEVRDEKAKVLRAIAPPAPDDVPRIAVRAQYGPGTVGGEPVPGYLEEEGVPRDSTTETYAAVRLEVHNWRWAGVPFYLRTGKRLARKLTEIAVTLKPVPHLGFTSPGSSGVRPNQLVLAIQPDEGVALSLVAKVPGTRMRLRPVHMDFLYGTTFQSQSPEAYERLILDVLRGDATLFTRGDEVEAQWRICDPIVRLWDRTPGPLPQYPAGSQGPTEAASILRPGEAWRRI
ncbi:MAG TPA: glucose-6-phosphate dehydrogenase [Solirubrobacter sp.]|nr:glucose-6-phosphate dehydrogenase [Solirubrobacter sp.]